MTPPSLDQLLSQGSEDFRRLNTLRALGASEAAIDAARMPQDAKSPQIRPTVAPKRLRQSSKPLLNKLETEFWDWMKVRQPEQTLRPQAKRYELARGIWFKPDFTTIHDGEEVAYEVKGPKAFRGGFENLKVAARVWPDVSWWLCWKDGGQWTFQQILK